MGAEKKIGADVTRASSCNSSVGRYFPHLLALVAKEASKLEKNNLGVIPCTLRLMLIVNSSHQIPCFQVDEKKPVDEVVEKNEEITIDVSISPKSTE